MVLTTHVRPAGVNVNQRAPEGGGPDLREETQGTPFVCHWGDGEVDEHSTHSPGPDRTKISGPLLRFSCSGAGVGLAVSLQ